MGFVLSAVFISDSVEIHGRYIPDKEVEKFFAASKLVILPYEAAKQGGIVQIAYGFEKTVVATNVGGLSEVVLYGRTGYVMRTIKYLLKIEVIRIHIMIGIYIIFFVIFPLSVMYAIRKNNSNTDVLLNKSESLEIKGLATCFVISAHLTYLIIENNVAYFRPLEIFTVLGGMGILLFFFVSGYGIYKGYACKKPSISFLKNRAINVIMPYMIMKVCFALISVVVDAGGFSLKDMIFIFISDWFIDVILIQYVIFYISWKVADWNQNNKKILFILNFVLNIAVALVFCKAGFAARWYNGLMLFPVGMLVAHYEKDIIGIWNKKWVFSFFINITLFLTLGILFTINKGSLWADLTKTVAGIFLSFIVCQFFIRYKLNSKIMHHIGKDSLYYYIIHLNIMSILSSIQAINTISEVYFTLIFTFLAVTFFSYIYRKLMISFMR